MGQRDEGAGHTQETDRERIRLEAAEWFAKVIDCQLNPADQRALEAWLAQDPRHADAYANIERLWRGSGELPEFKEHESDKGKLSRRDIGKGIFILAAGLAAWRYLSDHPLADYRTAVGEKRTIKAPDGSNIELAPETRLSLFYDDDVRKVALYQGEAYFQVAPDLRAFTVVAGQGETTAQGTAFSVQYRDGIADVVVTEHSVQVAAGGNETRVRSGSRVQYRETLGLVESVDADEALSWREGRLVFNGKPLGMVVAALNLWRRGRIIVVGRELSERPVTLLIDTDKVETIGEQLERALPVRLVQITPFLIFLLPA